MMKAYDPRGAAFARLGRFDPGEEACCLWWSGSGVRVRLDGSRLLVEADVHESDHKPWLAVTVDGAPAARFALRPGLHRYDALGGMEAGIAHEIAILRDTQPTDVDGGPLVLRAIHTDGTPSAPERRPLLVEFLGDSLTVGEGTVGPKDAMEWRMAWISNQFAFPSLVAEAMNADKRLIALGGWGAYRAYDGNAEQALGKIYDKLCALLPQGDVPYDFAAQRPADAVVINLGTNDNGGIALQGPERREAELAAFEESATRLLELVRARNPGSRILWAYGLCGDGLAAPIRRAIARRSDAGDAEVRYLALEDCAGDNGSRCHPGRRAHARAAEQIVRALDDWK